MTKLELAYAEGRGAMQECVELAQGHRSEAHELALVCFSGAGAACALSGLEALKVAAVVPLLAAAAYLFLLGGWISVLLLRRRPFPAAWNLPSNLLDHEGSADETLAGELRNLSARIARASTLLGVQARAINRVRLALAFTPIPAALAAGIMW